MKPRVPQVATRSDCELVRLFLFFRQSHARPLTGTWGGSSPLLALNGNFDLLTDMTPGGLGYAGRPWRALCPVPPHMMEEYMHASYG